MRNRRVYFGEFVGCLCDILHSVKEFTAGICVSKAAAHDLRPPWARLCGAGGENFKQE